MPHSQQKPKIKSIIPTNFPIKILQDGQRVVVIEDNNDTGVKSVVYTQNSFDQSNVCSQNKVLSSSLHSSEVHELKLSDKFKELSDSETLSDESFMETQSKSAKNKNLEVQECCNKIQNLTLKNSNKKSTILTETQIAEERTDTSNKLSNNNGLEKCVPQTIGNDSDQENDIEVTKILCCSQPQELNQFSCISQSKFYHENENKGTKCNKFLKNIVNCKENKENSLMKDKCNKNITSSSIKTLKDTTNPSNKIFKNIQLKKTSNKKLQIVPCTNKFIKKNSQIKKSTIFNADEKISNIIVQASSLCKNKCMGGISCINCSTKSNTGTSCEKKIESQNLLTRPEYNSTVCVMKKLKEVEKERLIPNFDDLAPKYKNFIFGKVSNVLDFSPYETVYKDLINLSLDQDKLPARLIRSKDPEPRDKDIIPALSDFYNPKCIEQYFVVANPITPNPTNVNPQSAFKINNKINTWKLSRDDCVKSKSNFGY